MLSWEYPPASVGGLAQHVRDLTNAMPEQVEVCLITRGPGGAAHEHHGNLSVYRVEPYHIRSLDFSSWTMHFNFSMLEAATPIISREGPFDLIHAHDWLAAYAARVLKTAFKLPMVATIHATEWGRNQGLHNDLQRYISDVEWWLCYEAWRVICCSLYMREELQQVFQTPEDKLRVIPNGVDPRPFQATQPDPGFRSHYAAPDEKIVFYVGRLVQEKGVQVLVEAATQILAAYPCCKFVIAGKGPTQDALQSQVRDKGLSERFYFTGYVEDQTKSRLYRVADVAVFPSLYEPFGIVALEAMAAGVPVVVSDVGGLREIIASGVNGLKAFPGQADSLAANILTILEKPDFAQQMARHAWQDINRYFTWPNISRQTVAVYEEVLELSGAWSGRHSWWANFRSSNRLRQSLPEHQA